MIRFLLISFVFFILLINCQPQTSGQLQSKKTIRNDIEMLYGKVTYEQLYFDYPQWKAEETAYKPLDKIISELKNINGTYDVDVFLGTWCSDSRREVPRFNNILKNAALLNKINVTLWAVDREQKLGNGLAQQNNIERVATFVFYKEKEEIGRIIETPEQTLEADILNILKANK